MNYRNRLMSLSLIVLTVFSACTDEVENGGQRPVKGDHSLSFAVSTPGSQAWTKADGTRAVSAPATQELEPVEMEGKVNGKTVYLSAEVTDGFPGDNRIMTRGTQVTEDNKTKDGIMETFAVSAYTSLMGTPDFMYSVPATKGNPENGTYYWYPEEKFYWPGVKSLYFYAWYPHTANAEGLTVSGANVKGIPTLYYTVPDDVKKQMDVMTAVAASQAEQEAIPLTFNHALAAVKFVAGDLMPQKFTIQSISLVGIKNKGSYGLIDLDWSLDDASTTDFTLSLNKVIDKTSSTAITADNETFFMLPQSFNDNSAKIEIVFTYANQSYTLRAALKGVTDKWEMGKTYTYTISTDMVVTADVIFFKGTNGTDGNPYTSHNISANSDPFTIDYRYPTGITSIKARLAYELTDGNGNVTYEAFSDEYDLKGEESKDFVSPCMNNLGDSTKAKKDETPFVVQIKVENPFVVIMPSDPDNPNTQLVYDPSKGDDQWFTIWRGKMFPPNAARAPEEELTATMMVARKNLNNGNLANWSTGATLAAAYWEVDENHPRYGKGKWTLPYCFWSKAQMRKSYLFSKMVRGEHYPGQNSLFGEAANQTIYWTNGSQIAGNHWAIKLTEYEHDDAASMQQYPYHPDLQMNVWPDGTSLGVRAAVEVEGDFSKFNN